MDLTSKERYFDSLGGNGMAGRQIFNPVGLKNIKAGEKVTGYEFQFKLQYYRGITLSMIRRFPLPIEEESFREQWFGWLKNII